MDVGQRVLWLLLALLTLALAHERTQARDQCFRLIAPTPEDDGTPYELDEDEYSELGLLFNINCEALPFAESMRVVKSLMYFCRTISGGRSGARS